MTNRAPRRLTAHADDRSQHSADHRFAMTDQHVHLTPARMPRSMQATQGPAWMAHGLPGALYKACPWAPKPQSLEDEASLPLDPSTPGALVMIVVLVVTTVTISPSGPSSFVVVVVVWLELGVGAGG